MMQLHCHTDYSQLRMLDCFTKVTDLINHTVDMGYKGVAITDHEALGGHVKAIQHVNEGKKKGTIPQDFKLILGNEIYLIDEIKYNEDGKPYCDTPFYHFILQAKDEVGHKQLRELSSLAWSHNWKTGKMERVPTVKADLERIVNKERGHLIAQSACIGGELGQSILNDIDPRGFINWCVGLFGEDFYLEMQPGLTEEQKTVNKKIVELSHELDIKTVITNDVHYLTQDLREIHAAYLNSKSDQERELDNFYEATWMMPIETIHERMDGKVGYEEVEIALQTTIEIGDKIQDFDLYHSQIVPKVNLPTFSLTDSFANSYDICPYIKKFATSDSEYDRYFLYLVEKGWWEKEYTEDLSTEEIKKMMLRINDELGAIWETTIKIEDNVSSYYITALDLINMMWDDSEDGGNSIVGPSRGSVASFYTCYLIGLHQINSYKHGIPWWRHLHKSRPEMPDVDIDSEDMKRARILEATKKKYGYDKVLNICTFKTEGSKSSILTAAKGLGIDYDVSSYIASLIPVKRGKTTDLTTLVYGDPEEDIKPDKNFINECQQYPKLLDCALAIFGSICGRSVHASGLIIFSSPYVDHNAMMKAPSGQPVTQFDMHDSEYMGGLKFDFLTITNLSAEHVCMDELVRFGKIQWQGSLRRTYDKYFHPDVIDYKSPKMWRMASDGEIVNLFQFQTQVGGEAVRKIKPKNLTQLGVANAVMRLSVEGDEEQPINTYVRYKNDINQWYECMKDYHLTSDEIKIVEKYLKSVHGMATMQEEVMEMVMEPKISNFNMQEANKARKGIAKKSKELQDQVKTMFFMRGSELGTSENLLNYVWHEVIGKQLGLNVSSSKTWETHAKVVFA